MKLPVAILCRAILVMATASTVVCGAARQDGKQTAFQARYRQWEREVPADSTLGRLKPLLERKYTLLPAGDLDDRSPLPLWFRVYMRLAQPDLRTSGPDQYGRAANRVLQALLDEPDQPDLKATLERLQRDR
jgi:hypothetical protein